MGSVRILMLGAKMSGKTTFVNRMCRDRFSERVAPTLGVEFYACTLEDGSDVRIWDLSGDRCFRSITHTYMRDTEHDIVILCHPAGTTPDPNIVRDYRDVGGTAPVLVVSTGAPAHEAPGIAVLDDSVGMVTVDSAVMEKSEVLALIRPHLPRGAPRAREDMEDMEDGRWQCCVPF
jgi:hypothetical protein